MVRIRLSVSLERRENVSVNNVFSRKSVKEVCAVAVCIPKYAIRVGIIEGSVWIGYSGAFAYQKFSLKKGLIPLSTENRIVVDGVEVAVVPAWKWMLS
jgi:hypothetical protein